MTRIRQRWDTPPSPRLAEFMRQGWRPRDEPAPRPSPPAALTARRRAALSGRLPGERLVVPAGVAPLRTNDQYYRFRPDSDYVWLSGDQSPAGLLVLEPDGDLHRPTLYLRPPSRRDDDSFWRDAVGGELWVGARPSLDTLSAGLGIDCRPRDELKLLPEPGVPTRVLHGLDEQADALAADTDEDADDMLRTILAELRLVKDDWELEQLRTAIAATADGFRDVARALRDATAMTERDVEGIFGHRTRALGNGAGYQTIAAAGPHATILHWTRNDGRLRSGDLLLLDAGAETDTLYTADITRTLPISGRFSGVQRDVYQIVLAAQDAGIGAVRAGRPFRDYHRAAAAVLAEGLHGLGLLPVTADESLREDCGLHRRWTLCAPGHMLGLDVHDCAQARADHYTDGTLEAGQVLTVEPGLYFQDNDGLLPERLRGLGVRIEDDVLVTTDGCELLSRALPREPGEIEAWIAAA
jgi:Xaa-Pro aminopeptidase